MIYYVVHNITVQMPQDIATPGDKTELCGNRCSLPVVDTLHQYI